MEQTKNQQILERARKHIAWIREEIRATLLQTEQNIKKGKEDFKTLSASDQVTQSMLTRYGERRLDELSHLYPSPYFVACDVLLEGESAPRRMYFAKFPFSEEEIYSWVSPIAGIRFQEPGAISYTKPDGEKQTGRLLQKEQYMIVDGKVVFLAAEGEGRARQLIYQEHFSSRKTGFVLPEIVAQMERAQDQVIRAHHVGPFVISGPAGSGKTTLALHRVAYLVQSPDTTHLYPAESIVVFVQDAGTQAYFSQLLPELGIHNVKITTFPEWAFGILGYSEVHFQGEHPGSEEERDCYEYKKLQALHSGAKLSFSARPFNVLEKVYESFFGSTEKKMWQDQKKSGVLDRIDLTLLLMAKQETKDGFSTVREIHVKQKNGTFKKKRERTSPKYSLVVMDEFQNYLPEQLRLIKTCTEELLRSMVYVGDMAQQIHFGTLRNWQEINEEIAPERSVKLAKVYRNTKSILEYIQGLGYAIQIPAGIKEGVPVRECVCQSVAEEIVYIDAWLQENKEGSLGILAKEKSYLEAFRERFGQLERAHIFTMEESQGVEFDAVCIVGFQKELFLNQLEMTDVFLKEKQKIMRDLLYVALTRAISELHVLGK